MLGNVTGCFESIAELGEQLMMACLLRQLAAMLNGKCALCIIFTCPPILHSPFLIRTKSSSLQQATRIA